MQNYDLLVAEELGMIANGLGQSAVPMFNEILQEYKKEVGVTEFGDICKIEQAWLNGWHRANAL